MSTGVTLPRGVRCSPPRSVHDPQSCGRFGPTCSTELSHTVVPPMRCPQGCGSCDIPGRRNVFGTGRLQPAREHALGPSRSTTEVARWSRRSEHAAGPSPGGRIPPHNLEAEESLLGVDDAQPRGDHRRGRGPARARATSTSPRTASIFEAAFGLHSRGEPVDPVTVAEELRRSGAARPARRPPDAAAHPGVDARVGERVALRADRRRARRCCGASSSTAGDIQEMAYAAKTPSTKRSTAPERRSSKSPSGASPTR